MTDTYSRDYAAGFRTGMRATEGALERADDRGVSEAWYDGYLDAAAGRPKWTYRQWRINGCESSCAESCNGSHKTSERE